jgi:serine-type D-Ala-D-Ala carboxypeptidase (penicillin-binding protein 5/6)
VWPLTDTAAGVIPPTSQSGGSTRPGGTPSQPVALWDTSALHAPIAGVHASASIVVDSRSGRVLWEQHPHAALPVASLTKLMTGLVVMREHAKLGSRFVVTRPMTGVPGYTVGLRIGQTVTVRGMLAAALIASGNDAANALAVFRAGSVHAFVARMNTAARTLHLADTHYSNPSGIFDAGNSSSAWDEAVLAREFMTQPALRALVRLRVYPSSSGGYLNRNRLLWTYRGAIGIKTGSTTAAGNCLAAAAVRGGRTLIVVVLHGRGDPFAEAKRLLDWGFRHGG